MYIKAKKPKMAKIKKNINFSSHVGTVYYENCKALSSGLEIDFSARTAKRY